MRAMTVVEIVLSYISIGWALVLLTSPTLFDSGGSWDMLKEIVPGEWAVGLIALTCALTKIVGMIIRNVRMRCIGLWMSTAFWITIAAGMLMTNGYPEFNTGFIAYSGLAVMSLWTSKEVKIDDTD